MRKLGFATVAFLVVAGVVWAASRSRDSRGKTSTEQSTRTILYYRDPMHPAYTSTRPGKAPDCGMELQPVYAENPSALTGVSTDGSRTEPTLIYISAERQQLAGIRTSIVKREALARTVRTFGKVLAEEDRVFPVVAGGEGWVTRTLPGTASGSVVDKGQPLASIYGRDYTTAQRTFLYALRTSENPPPVARGEAQDQTAFTLQEARLALLSLGFGKKQIDEIAATHRILPEVSITAPAKGVIVARAVAPNQKFDRGMELFRIADLSRVWIDADLLADDYAYVQRDTRAVLSVPGIFNDTVDARFTASSPRYDSKSRTLKLRLEAMNPELVLRPEMFVNVDLTLRSPEVASVPSDAVVDTGVRKTVFVNRGSGIFEPRVVQTGWHSGGRVEIVKGLTPGESVVVSGTFLLDSENQFRERATGGHD